MGLLCKHRYWSTHTTPPRTTAGATISSYDSAAKYLCGSWHTCHRPLSHVRTSTEWSTGWIVGCRCPCQPPARTVSRHTGQKKLVIAPACISIDPCDVYGICIRKQQHIVLLCGLSSIPSHPSTIGYMGPRHRCLLHIVLIFCGNR